MDKLIFLWLILLIAFIVIEAATVNLTTIWFAGGALVALVFSLFGVSIFWQVAIFLVVTALLLIFTKPIVQRHFNNKLTATNIQAMMGKQAIVTETIDNVYEKGAVQVDGLTWTARSVDQQTISEGMVIEVVDVKGVTLYVKSKSNNESA
ncbi:MAG: NfeD family protein [Erysipelotrichaceae bacterium]|nr:NfeD family protein [Erysipelotrichaceae bacterium]